MRLFELDSLPKKAGVATITWGTGVPSRKKKEIKLPQDDDVQYFPLQGGVQFLVVVPDNDDYERMNSRLFFGGTDEQPFLVEMNPDALLGLKNGEAGFYDAIKPEGAKFCEEKFGTKAIRQGDWFAVPMSLNWGSMHGLLGLFCRDHKVVTKNENGIPIGGTRHLLVEGQLVITLHNKFGCTGIAEGLLRAPDHEDKILKGPHALFQTRYLREPEKAD